jgi:uncharacterized protein YhaN
VRFSSRLMSLVLAAGFIVSSAAVLKAQPESVSVTPAREAKAIAFARKHHPELADLLARLKKADAQAYEKALREVSQNTERLSKLRETDTERYDFSLRMWTLDSRIRLLAARSTMSNDPGIENELRELLRERQDLRLAMLKVERERLHARLERLNGQIQQLESDLGGVVENDFARIQREIKAAANRERRAAEQAQPKKPNSKSDRNDGSGNRKPKPNANETSGGQTR